MISKEEEILIRLDRIETIIEKMAEQSQQLQQAPQQVVVQAPVVNTAAASSAESDVVSRMMRQIIKDRENVHDQEYLSYLADMEAKLKKENDRLGQMQKNLDMNRQVYFRKHPELQPLKPLSIFQNETAPKAKPAAVTSDETPVNAAPVDAAPADATDASSAAPGQVQEPAKKVHSAEFNFGGIVLSIVGAVFVILSLVIFGKLYMDNLTQGIALYGIGILILLFSEIVLTKHLESFSRVISGVGLGVLYTATILNYLYLNTIKAPAAIIITLAISVFALFFSRKKDSGFLRIIGILGCYISFVPLQEFEKVTDFAVPALILIIVNVLYLSLPGKTHKTVVRVIHALANVAVAGYFSVVLLYSESLVRQDTLLYLTGFLAGFIVINAFMFKGSESDGETILSICCEAVFAIILLTMLAKSDVVVWGTLMVAAAMAVCFYLDRTMERLCWVHLYIFTVFLGGVMLGQDRNVYLCIVAGILLCYKLLEKKEELAIANLIVTGYAALVFLIEMKDSSNMQFLILGVMVVSLLFLHYFKTFHECLVLGVLTAFAYMGFDQEEISVLLALGFVVLFLILYQVFDHLRDENFKIYTGMSAGLGLVALLAAAAVDHYKYVALSGVLLLGLVMLFLLFGKSYRLFGDWGQKNRNLVIAGFLTYMILIFRIEKPVITSILLMALALCAVGVGFGIHQKPLRLYGLFLAVFVCAKLLLYDFSESGSGEKVVLFFVVGLLAIGISYLYMRLEKQEG
ncbi:MAG: DUF2339 domain-containing protein [Lachnospiraceae bacterium]|nr:DUF2339 domain-containing protein [Lachnospiraceae bacterium]